MFKFENEETSVLKTATKFFVHFLFYISDCGENRGNILKITTKCTTTNLIVEKDD
ncbi:hypothetical protein NBO_48g0009 [Nosema bombycis CQ1]|uniref:Uncharacterized protein n=1 Tax=Nosema bombycis (strain CQ1 / CVCC 102059) TaxID=578461 RepID=R0M7J9_NOSB1|nr:hypothetical protein NBO_48g0009 [Nosema bombycis CQ1]|eukprot:EOB13959.1 hypothetical protein NBO_48g0009 [Nosema bombycis CQ1]